MDPHDRVRRANPASMLALVLALASLGATGCIELEDHLTINADGTGTVRLATRSLTDSPPQAMMMWLRSELDSAPVESNYPAAVGAQAGLLFPGDAFEIESGSEPAPDGKPGRFVATVRFKSIDALLATPYAAARSLSITRTDGGRLVVRSTTGLRPIAAYNPPEIEDGEFDPNFLPNPVVEAPKTRGKLTATFRVTLPADAATDDAGAAVEGRTVTWRIDGPAIGDDGKLAEALWSVMSVSCDAGELKPSASPVRLDLLPYAELRAGGTGAVADAVIKAARTAPLAVSVDRSFDIAGRGFLGQNSTTVVAAITLPSELAPTRWGDFVLAEAADNLGTNLARPPAGDGDRYVFGGRLEPAPARQRDGRHVHPLVVTLKAPPIDATLLRKITGSIELMYPGAPHVVKIDAVVDPKTADASNDDGDPFDGPDNEPAKLQSPSLTEIDASGSLDHYSRNGGFTSLYLNLTGAEVARAVVFDAQGKSWPTYILSQDGDGLNLIVIGEPTAPLSLALFVSGGGAKVKLPVQLKDIPLLPEPAEKGQEPTP